MLDVANLIRETKLLPARAHGANDRLDRRLRGHRDGTILTKLFGDFLVFVYHCFDRIVIHSYLTALSRPDLVVHFFRDIVCVVLSRRTADYQRWVEAYARNRSIPIKWAERGVRKEDHVLLRPLSRNFIGIRLPARARSCSSLIGRQCRARAPYGKGHPGFTSPSLSGAALRSAPPLGLGPRGLAARFLVAEALFVFFGNPSDRLSLPGLGPSRTVPSWACRCSCRRQRRAGRSCRAPLSFRRGTSARAASLVSSNLRRPSRKTSICASSVASAAFCQSASNIEPVRTGASACAPQIRALGARGGDRQVGRGRPAGRRCADSRRTGSAPVAGAVGNRSDDPLGVEVGERCERPARAARIRCFV